MKRLLVVLAISAGLLSSAALGAFGLSACGGPDKPPMTPDTELPGPEQQPEAGSSPAPSAPSK